MPRHGLDPITEAELARQVEATICQSYPFNSETINPSSAALSMRTVQGDPSPQRTTLLI